MDESLESYLQELFSLVEEHDLAELRLEGPEVKIKIRKAEALDDSAPRPAAQFVRKRRTGQTAPPPPSHAELAAQKQRHLHELRSPIVGVFYRASTPEAASFAEVGDFIKTGQVVCLIEAMKVFNEIHADCSGRVVKVLASNGEVVDVDQPLMLIDESASQPEGE